MSYEILIPYHSNKKMLNLCVYSLLETTPKEVKITIIANNENSAEIDISFSDSRITVIKVHKSMYYPFCINFGLQYIKSENVFLIDSDTYHIAGWYEEITKIFESDTNIAIVGSCLIDMKTNRVRDYGMGFTGYNWAKIFKGQKITSSLIKDREFQAVCTASSLIRKKYYFEVGGFSEECNISYSDIELCLKFKNKGYKVMGAAKSVAYHKGNISNRIVSLYKTDCRSIFFAKSYSKMKIDMNDYMNISYSEFCQTNKLYVSYLFVNLSSILNANWYVKNIKELLKIEICDVYDFPSTERDQEFLNLPLIIKTDVFRNKYPIIYFVDTFLSLSNNLLWKKLRDTTSDLIIDRNGNILNFR